jgi:hypothetical protein
VLGEITYALTPRDGQTIGLALINQTHTPFGRSVSSANVIDVFELLPDLPRLWSPRCIFIDARPGGAQTLSGYIVFAEAVVGNANVILAEETGLALTTIRRAFYLPSDLWFDSRYHRRLNVAYQFSAGAVANVVTSTVNAITVPIGNVSPSSFAVSGAP